jgi:hypothetical protein
MLPISYDAEIGCIKNLILSSFANFHLEFEFGFIPIDTQHSETLGKWTLCLRISGRSLEMEGM